MRQEEDDLIALRRRRENQEAPFPYVYPDMPPRFRRCRRFAQALFLLAWGSLFALIAGLLLQCAAVLIRGLETPMEGWLLFLFGLTFGVLLPLSFLARWLRHTPGWFWHCPSCRQPFPYYAPYGKLDALRERDCLASLRRLRIGVVKTKFCPLVIPSECPWCRRKFFAIQGGSLDWDQERP